VTRVVIADTGPLIALARIGQLDLLRRLYGRVVVPPAVHTELAIDSNRPGAKALVGVFAAGWADVVAVTDASVRLELDQLLGPGEAEAIALAEQEDTRFLLIDDARGRRTARSRGIPVVGVAGVLLAAKSRGELSAVGPVLDRLSSVGYRLSPRLVAGTLLRARE
jgi:predicted nucleic acid-binding protein